MRIIIFALLLCFSSLAMAQDTLASMQEAMECMNSLDQDALREFGEQGEEVAEKIKVLCDKGDESAARNVALAYVKELADSQELIKLKECTHIMREAMPSFPIPEIPGAEMYEEQADSICENLD